MSRSVLWRLFSLLSILQVSVLAELNYHEPSRGASSIFTNTGAEFKLGENAIAYPWDILTQDGLADNMLADFRREATDEANSLRLNMVISPPPDQAQSPESLWLSESVDCQPSENPTPNKNRRIRRQPDVICPSPRNNMNNQLIPGPKAGTQTAPLQISPPILRQDRKPTSTPNSEDRPKPILKGGPVSPNEWICNHRTINYPVCADLGHATEMPLGSGSYELLMAKLCEDPFSEHVPHIISLFQYGGLATHTLVHQEPIFGTSLADRITAPFLIIGLKIFSQTTRPIVMRPTSSGVAGGLTKYASHLPLFTGTGANEKK